MNEHPLIVTTELIPKILDGTKTQTRRLNELNEINKKPDNWCSEGSNPFYDSNDWLFREKGTFDDIVHIRCPYGQVGDRLVIRESHKLEKIRRADGWWVKATYKFPYNDNGERWFKWADIPKAQRKRLSRIKTWGKWRPARFMYRFLARIFCEITNIRVERLLEISPQDCYKEGVPTYLYHENFIDIWNSLNAKRGYPGESNPWVFVIEFKLDG